MSPPRSANVRAKARASRGARVPGRGAQLRERDVDILLALAKMRLLRTSDLSRLFFSAKGTTQKRMRKLYDAGVVRAVVTELSSENRYALTRLGHELLEQALEGADVPAFRPAPRVDGRSVAHLDLLNAYRIALAIGATANGLELRTFHPEWDLRSKDPLGTLVPDAVFSIVDPTTDSLCCALEVDTGTEAGPIVLRKLTKYRERHALRQPVFGFTPDVVLLLTKTERRARSLAKQIARSGGAGAAPLVLMGIEETVKECGGVRTGLTIPKRLSEAAPGERAFELGLRRVFRATG